MSAYVAACALQKPKPANFPRNRSRSLRPENFAEARRMRSASASDMLPSVCEICITCSWKMQTPSESPSIFWSAGCAYWISSSPRSRFTNNSFDPYSAAPGRIRANACATSSSVRAFIVRKRPRMAGGNHIARRRIVFRYGVKINFARLRAWRHSIGCDVRCFRSGRGKPRPYGLEGAIDVVERERHRRESALAEQIHFYQSECFDIIHVVLRDDDAFCGALQWR